MPSNPANAIGSPDKAHTKNANSTMAFVLTSMGASDSAPTLQLVQKFVQEVRRYPAQTEILALKYLKIFKKDIKLQVKVKDVQKLLPNVNIKSEKRLLALFGVALSNHTNPDNSKEILYDFVPNKYILATMVNSMTFDQFEKRINFAFQMYDHDDDGRISRSDLIEMLSMYGKEGQFRIDEKTIGELVDAILLEIDESQDGLISQTEFQAFFEGYKSKDVKFDIFEKRKATQADTYKQTTTGDQEPDPFIRQSERQPEAPAPAKNPPKIARTYTNASTYSSVKSKILIDGPQWIWFGLWLAGLVYFFTSKFIHYYDKTGAVAVGFAKGFAGTISYNMAIMIALITKSLTTILRLLGFSKLLPLDFNVSSHAFLGFVTLAGGWGHSLAHMIGSTHVLSEMSSLEALNSILYTPVDQVHSQSWWITKSVPGITGLIVLALMTLMVVLAVKPVRHKYFERFWYTHTLWIVVIPLLCVHGIKQYLAKQAFYWWVGVPTIVLILEKLYKVVVYLRQRFEIANLEYLDSGVIELAVNKPKFFKYLPGQYARINIPQISKLQWHPFSFSSSPDQQVVSFHISPVGDWTNGLKELATNYKAKKLPKSPIVYLEGPFGAPSQDYTSFKNIMIVSSGVGATPFASIMRHLNHKLRQDVTKAEEGSVSFYWVNRKPTGHVWLSSLFRDLQNDEASKGFIKINMYFTSAHAKYDIRSLLLWRGIETLHKQGKKIKGLEHFEMMHWGRPEWSEIFKEKVREIGSGTVGVFFCGNNFLADELYKNCIKYTGKVVFKFHKEIF